MTAGPILLEAKQLAFAYQADRPILKGVDFSAAEGVFTTVLGPNGSGKTTLKKYDVRHRARLQAYVPQTPRSAFAFTAEKIVLMGRLAHTGPLGIPSQDDHAVVKLAMEMTDSVAFADRALEELSGGEAQRVMIARALAQQPAVLLLDEPTSHLDIRHQMTIYRMMQRLAHEWRIAVVCVSHDLNLASRFADRMVLMKDGAVLADGGPADVLQRDVLESAYDVGIELFDTPGSEFPMVQAK
jgi:iron complex transport system ATP-binding protein